MWEVLKAISHGHTAILRDLAELKREIRQMSLDFTKLDATAAEAVALLNQLAAQIAAIPVSTDPTTQAHIDGLTKTLGDAVTADTPVAPVGATGA